MMHTASSYEMGWGGEVGGTGTCGGTQGPRPSSQETSSRRAGREALLISQHTTGRGAAQGVVRMGPVAWDLQVA